MAKGGSLNYIIPTALLTDEGSTRLRKHILEDYCLEYFYGFENRLGLFPDVHRSYKFGLMGIIRPREPLPEAEKISRCQFCLTNPVALAQPETGFDYSTEDVAKTSPQFHAFMEVPGRAELAILLRIYSGKWPTLNNEWLDFRNELHATNDKKIFLDPKWLDFRRELDATNDKKIFLEKKPANALPLYKGACIWQYDSRYFERTHDEANRNEYWLEPDQFDD